MYATPLRRRIVLSLSVAVLLLLGLTFSIAPVSTALASKANENRNNGTPKASQTPAPSPSPEPTASPSASPASSPGPTESPSTSPEATPETGPTVSRVEVLVNGAVSPKVINLVQGETRTLTVKAFDANNVALPDFQSKWVPSKEGVVQIAEKGKNVFTITALGVAQSDSTSLALSVNDQAQAEQTQTIKVVEAVTQIEAEEGNAVSLPEGDSFTVKLKLKGAQSETLDPLQQQFDVEMTPALKAFLRNQRDPQTGGYILTALPLSSQQQSVTGNVVFRARNGLNGNPSPPLTISVTVRQKFGYITFEPPPKGFLLPGGSFSTLAVVRSRFGSPMSNYGVEFRPENERDLRWISLSPEGNKINIYWNDPADEEITKADGTKERRPSQVKITVTARSQSPGEEINGTILVRMGEVAQFALIKVKLNLMDQVTAGDLYGKVLADEYYVLTVRLFNNLRDDLTKEFTGDSILAYSSSMEIAVGLEKKFNGSNNSDFVNVISKGEARRLSNKRSEAAEELAIAQANSEIDAAKKSQSDLEAAIKDESSALRDARTARTAALDFRDRVQVLAKKLRVLEAKIGSSQKPADQKELRSARANYDASVTAATNAILEANLKIRRAREAAAETTRLRADILRAAANRVTVSQNIAANSDPDTAIDDGRWHAVNQSDFNRISEPTPLEPEGLEPLPELDSELLANADVPSEEDERSTGVRQSEDLGDFPCRGAITYRPFTFEMMVNTVDRRDGRSTRSRLFKFLDAIGTGTSFITSIAVPGSSSDLPLGLEKYSNLLIPGIDKLYPNFKEQNRQNIVAQAMKEIEEIPFGSDITRVVFIPKKTIRGLIRGHDTRISEVCPFYFKIEVAIISKRSTVTAGRP
jgi:hypothetical protein